MGNEAAVGFELGHAHVAAGADRRYALAGAENEDIAVEDVFFRDDGHSRQDRVVTAIQAGKGVAYLVHLHFQAGQVLLVDIAHADRTDDVLAGQEQADEHGRTHIAQGDDMDAGLPGQLRCLSRGMAEAPISPGRSCIHLFKFSISFPQRRRMSRSISFSMKRVGSMFSSNLTPTSISGIRG